MARMTQSAGNMAGGLFSLHPRQARTRPSRWSRDSCDGDGKRHCFSSHSGKFITAAVSVIFVASSSYSSSSLSISDRRCHAPEFSNNTEVILNLG